MALVAKIFAQVGNGITSRPLSQSGDVGVDRAQRRSTESLQQAPAMVLRGREPAGDFATVRRRT
jgi:hypothetical protein